jgi:hypothetical protein
MNMTATTVKAKLTVSVARHEKFTAIMVKMGSNIVATAKFGGKWDEKSVLREFSRFPNRFQLTPKFANLTPNNIRALVG